MDETKLNRLRKELADNYREFEKEMAKLEKDSKVEDGFFFSHERKREQAKAKMAKLKEVMDATEDLQKSISASSTATPDEQEKAHKKLVELKDKYNFKSSNCKYDINRPIYNTLVTHHNRSVKKNFDHPIRTIFTKGALALIPWAAIPILPAIGLGAVATALAGPLAWLGGGLILRAGVHAVQGFARRTTVANVKKKDASVTYDSLYPTQSEVKGFFRTLSYNREIKKTAGKLYSSLETVDGYKDFKGTEFPHSGEKPDDEKTKEGEKGKEKEKEKGKEDDKAKERKEIVDKFIEKVKNTEIKSIDDVNALVKEEAAVIPYTDESNRELLNVISYYLKLARKVLDKTADEEYATMLKAFVKEDTYKTPEAKALQNLLVGKLVELAKSIGAYDEFIKPFYDGEKEKTGEKGKGGEGSGGKEGSGSGEDHGSGSGSDDDPTKGKGEKGDGGRKPAPVVPEGESIAKSSEALTLLRNLREFDVTEMTIENYNKANRLIAKIEKELRVRPDDLQLSVDDEMTLAEVRSMADAYEAKTALVDKLKICEATMNVGKFYKEAFEDCIKEFYNIVGHTTYINNDGQRTSVRNAASRNLLSVNDYERVKKVLNYYKKTMNYDSSVTLSDTTKFAEGQINREEYLRDWEEALGVRTRGK